MRDVSHNCEFIGFFAILFYNDFITVNRELYIHNSEKELCDVNSQLLEL